MDYRAAYFAAKKTYILWLARECDFLLFLWKYNPFLKNEMLYVFIFTYLENINAILSQYKDKMIKSKSEKQKVDR